MDKYEQVRSLPFPELASALGISLERFNRKGQEWTGPCPTHGSKDNTNCFRYYDTGVYHCFSWEAKGRGAIDLTKTTQKARSNQLS